MTQFLERVYPYSTIGVFTPGWRGLIFSKLLVKLLDLIWIYSEWVYGSFIKFPVVVSSSFHCSFFEIHFSRDSVTKNCIAKQGTHRNKRNKNELMKFWHWVCLLDYMLVMIFYLLLGKAIYDLTCIHSR